MGNSTVMAVMPASVQAQGRGLLMYYMNKQFYGSFLLHRTRG